MKFPVNGGFTMSQHGAALQTYNQELVKCLEEMKLRRSELQAQIESQDEEKNNLHREIEKMSCKLTQLNDSLAKRIAVRNEYDRTIADTEAAYVKILESSQLLLNMIKKEAVSLDQTLIKTNIDKQQYQ
ncbi:PREDICTED: Sjoegren syndrome nuclear autoantigen 1 homolog isoform X1 [Wasmannia auropunctata]|uniref:Sjoegren syndrome nuclear autoantigen 1 homolog isoform X1 n=1 Tax=Wasmannia auropunctata TaxID=64793 RepID=UPI0005EF3E96|nr:PREDICTED: Sjoegren syndrome nuclear autoantigen 1 homolog isoform X1 [Wasmannia auropunctata]